MVKWDAVQTRYTNIQKFGSLRNVFSFERKVDFITYLYGVDIVNDYSSWKQLFFEGNIYIGKQKPIISRH